VSCQPRVFYAGWHPEPLVMPAVRFSHEVAIQNRLSCQPRVFRTRWHPEVKIGIPFCHNLAQAKLARSRSIRIESLQAASESLAGAFLLAKIPLIAIAEALPACI
jgi:hypothetical protein